MSTMENAYALVIGIANYQNVNKLPPTVLKDARDIYNVLIDPQHCGYSKDNVQLLLDGEVTKAVIRQALLNLAELSNQDSTVLIYISGHGGRVEFGPYKGEYLLPVDANYSSGISLAQTAISGTQFTEALQAIPAHKIAVIFDCCHAGGIAQPKDVNGPIIKTGLPESYYDSLQKGGGRVILASCRSTEQSYVQPGAANSLFTQHLLDGLRGNVASEDGLIRISDIFEYIQPRVTAAQSNQHPIFKADLEEFFPIALYLGGQKGILQKNTEGFRYDVYISYAKTEPDDTWVWETLIPRLKEVGLKVAVSEDVFQPGVDRVVTIPRGLKQAKRTLMVLSDAYLTDKWLHFERVMAETIGVQEDNYRLLPVMIEPLDDKPMPDWITGKHTVDLTKPRHVERRFKHLVDSLKEPLPQRRLLI